MLFSTSLVEFSTNKWVRLLLAAVILLVAGIIVAWSFNENTLVTVLFGACVALVIIFAGALKGKIQLYGLSDEKLIITSSSIIIKDQTWVIKNLKKLVFTVDSYSGMTYSTGGGGSNISDGMRNMISFVADGKKVQYNFFLESAPHTTSLCSIFKEFYIQHIPFIEKDMFGHQTYMLQRLNQEELEAFKLKYGYTKK